MKSKFLGVICAGAMATCFAQEASAPVDAGAGANVDLAALVERMAALEAALKAPSPEVAALTERLAQLEETNRAQAARIAELEGQNKQLAAAQEAGKRDLAAAKEQYKKDVAEFQALYHRDIAAVKDEAKAGIAAIKDETKMDIAAAREATKKDIADATALKWDETTERSESGRIFTTELGAKYYLADTTARIFEPLSESGLKITPYGYLTFEAVHNTHKTDVDIYTDWVRPRGNGGKNGDHQTAFSMNDSIIGFNFEVPEAQNGWRFNGKFEFDLAGDNANDPDFHLRHLYFAMDNEELGWNILFGQTWHLWKMVTPNEIDGAWMEQCGHPYRRSPQVRLTKTFKFDDDKTLELRAGIVKNGNGMGGDRDKDDNQDNSASAWPLFEGAIVYTQKAPWESDKSDRRFLVGLAGMYGRDKSHRFSPDGDGGIERYEESDEYDTDMIMAALQLPFLEKFTFTGQLFAGENLAGVQGGIGQGVAIEDPTRKGREVSTIGGFFDLRYDFSDRWAFAVGYGFDDPTDSRARYAEGRTFNERAYADIFYQFNANLHFGLEYARLRTRYYEDDDASNDRFQFTAFYDF